VFHGICEFRAGKLNALTDIGIGRIPFAAQQGQARRRNQAPAVATRPAMMRGG